MAEMIYTKISPLVDGQYWMRNTDLVKSIKQEGVKFPIACECTDGYVNYPLVGRQRLLIALSLGLEEIPAILYSTYYKTGFEGIPITDTNDIVKVCGESIKKEPVYASAVSAIKNIRRRNNYPPDPLKIKVQSDD